VFYAIDVYSFVENLTPHRQTHNLSHCHGGCAEVNVENTKCTYMFLESQY